MANSRHSINGSPSILEDHNKKYVSIERNKNIINPKTTRMDEPNYFASNRSRLVSFKDYK